MSATLNKHESSTSAGFQTDRIHNTSRTDISQWMLPGIPSSKAQIQPTNESQLKIKNNKLLMMSKVKRHISSILKHIMIRMSHNMNLPMTFTSRRTQRPQRLLRMVAVTRNGRFHLFIHNNKDLHTTLRRTLQALIQPPFLIGCRRSS